MKTPLRTEYRNYEYWALLDANGLTIATIWTTCGVLDKEAERLAREIVRQVNAHDALVEACEGFSAALMVFESVDQKMFDAVDDYLSENIIELRAALAFAKADQ